MMKIDQSKICFDKFKTEYNDFILNDMTEADTRSKLLDELFKTVLGWTEKDIDREGHTEEGYYDYQFSIPGFNFVVEAKKNFIEFKLPVKHRSVTLGTLKKDNGEVISQIRRYLVEVGLQYGVISNGRQFIIGKFINSDRSDWQKNKCIIFNGIEEIEERFIEFYNLLSKYAIIENSGFIISNEENKKGQIILSTIRYKDSELIRNSLSSNLVPIIDKVFGEIYKYEILDDKELLKECFIENEEIKKNKSDIEKLFADKPPELTEVIPARNTKNIAKQIEDEINNHGLNVKGNEAPKPIIIVGSKGAGKTTFINYLFKLSFSDNFLESRPYIYLDFRRYTEEDIEKVSQTILRDAIELLYENYSHFELHSLKVLKRIFIKEIKQNDESIWGYDKFNDIDRYNQKLNSFLEENRNDKEFYFIKLSEYLIRERRLRLCVVIDNADQFDINVQKKAFLFAQSINRKAKCAVIISLREGYYYRWRHLPPFDAFASNVYHITAPPYKEVLQKRIDYALQNIQIDGKTSGTFGESLNIELGNNAVKDFLQSVKQTLFGYENSEILTFLEETTYPNIREGLEIFKHFLLSGHTDVAEYVLRQKISPNSSNIIPFWEFVRSVALDNKKYFNHEISRVHNLFFPAEDSPNHFLKIKILKYLFNRVEKLGYTEKFIPTEQVVIVFTNAGYKLNLVINELNELLRYKFIETDDSLSDKEFDSHLEEHQNISISLKGNYYVNDLLCSFVYLDLMLHDTPIFDTDHYEKIRSLFPLSNEQGKQNLQARIDTTQAFVEYLSQQEKRETIESDDIAKDIIKGIRQNGLDKDIRRIKNAQQRLADNGG
ncbi:MAG: hypothetical protein IPN20_15185 [Haliscomenobacter sp.]|nr:hypothetical protein [Haliscomenobacter sp.]